MLHNFDFHQKVRRMSADERSHALKDVKAAMALHDTNSAYYAKLLAEYDCLVDEMAQECMREYRRRYGR